LLKDLFGQVAGCFPRRETRQAASQMAAGLLMELEDCNCWSIAEAAGHSGPHRLQHLLSRAVWDEQRLLDTAAAWAVGTLGGIALCQVAVTLTLATSRGHALIGRKLYLPGGCAADEEHRELAGVPEEVMFAAKPELAGDLLARAHERGIRAAFVAGDEVCSGRQLRRAIRSRGIGYVLAVRANHALTVSSGRAMTAARAARLIPREAWHRIRTGHGSKGLRHYDWAMLEVTSDDTPSGHSGGYSVLLVRRHRYTGTLSFYRCWTPGPVPLSRLIAVASARWRIEEDHQLTKQVAGLDAGQVIRWKSWHRWTAICLLAYIYLAVAVAVQRQHDAGSDLDDGLIPITVPELLRLLRDIVIPPPRRDRAHLLHWSEWRRRHQHRARQAHQSWNAYAERTP
jgi:SRSO17 transposase